MPPGSIGLGAAGTSAAGQSPEAAGTIDPAAQHVQAAGNELKREGSAGAVAAGTAGTPAVNQASNSRPLKTAREEEKDAQDSRPEKKAKVEAQQHTAAQGMEDSELLVVKEELGAQTAQGASTSTANPQAPQPAAALSWSVSGPKPPAQVRPCVVFLQFCCQKCMQGPCNAHVREARRCSMISGLAHMLLPHTITHTQTHTHAFTQAYAMRMSGKPGDAAAARSVNWQAGDAVEVTGV